MRILVLSQYYKPEPIPKPSDLVEELIARGHSVSVVTGLPNYPSGILYSGYRLRLVHREKIDDACAVRTYEFPYHGKSAIGRILNYASFMITAPIGALFVPRCDVIYVYHPPLTVGVAAWVIAKLRRVPFVYDVQDIWPESIVLSGMLRNRYLIWALSQMERFIYKRADHIFVITEGGKRNLTTKGVRADKISVMPHWIDEAKMVSVDTNTRSEVRRREGWTEKCVVLFAGNIGVIQGLETVVEVAALLPRGGRYLICLLGNGSDKKHLQDLAKSLKAEDRIQFLASRPAEDMPPLMGASDALLVYLKKAPLADCVIPTKIFTYLSVGKPILIAMEGPAADLVRDSGAGMIVPPGDAEALCRAIQQLDETPPEVRNFMGESGRRYLTTFYPKQKGMTLYEQMLERIVRSRNTSDKSPSTSR